MINFKYLISFILIVTLFSCGEKKGGNTPITSDSKTLTSFSIETPSVSGIRDEENKTVLVVLPSGTSKIGLVAVFVTTGVKVTVNGVEQNSSETPNNFTNPVVYTIHAENGSTVNYTITVTVASESDKSITFFSILGITADINEVSKTITLVVPHETILTSLIATFVTSGTVVKVGGITQINEETSNDFTNSVVYKIIAANLSEQNYTVTVTKADSVTTYVVTKNIASFPTDTDFFYLLEIGKELWYYRNKDLIKATTTYTETTLTYVDGVLTNSVTSGPITYSFTDFFSIGTGVSKILYFVIESKNYKQENGVISEIATLPTRPIKSRVIGSTLNFIIRESAPAAGPLHSEAIGKPNDTNNMFETDIISDYVETYGPNLSGWQTTKCLFTNASVKTIITFVDFGLYYLPKSINSGLTGILIKAGKGEMW